MRIRRLNGANSVQGEEGRVASPLLCPRRGDFMHPPPFLCPKENPLEMPKEKTRPMDYIYICMYAYAYIRRSAHFLRPVAIDRRGGFPHPAERLSGRPSKPSKA